MRIIDAHCDVLSKMLMDPDVDFAAAKSSLDVTLPRLKKARMAVQCFAIYLPEKIKQPGFDHILQQIEIFHQNILSHHEMMFIKTGDHMEEAVTSNKIGALLSLEGADGLAANVTYLHIAFYLGVRCLGLTWNYANWAADGVMEPRKGGLTLKGQRLVNECSRLGMILDISHLSERGFWDVCELSDKPFIASHANAFDVCRHPRNLTKEQLIAIIQINGTIGITFVPGFVKSSGDVKISDILTHIDYICSFGGMNHIGFGSDFDGIDRHIEGLANPGMYDNLVNELCKHYKPELVERLLFRNWYEFFKANLPRQEV